MNKLAKGGGAIALIIFLLILFFGWGFLGGQEAQKIGITCDMGLGDSLCWKWHKNIVGQIEEGFRDTGSAIEDFFEDIFE